LQRDDGDQGGGAYGTDYHDDGENFLGTDTKVSLIQTTASLLSTERKHQQVVPFSRGKVS